LLQLCILHYIWRYKATKQRGFYIKTIAFHLQKGGVGKTTIVGTIGNLLKKKFKVLLIDADPQSNLSSWFFSNEANAIKFELSDVLLNPSVLDSAILEKFGLYFLTSYGLDGGLRVFAETKLHDNPLAFMHLLEDLEKYYFDVVIFDLSPSHSRLEKAILAACNEVITPIIPEMFAVDGLAIFNSELKKIELAYRKKIRHNRLIINAYDARINQHKMIVEQADKLKYEKFVFPVDPIYRKSQALNISPVDGMKETSLDSYKLLINSLAKG